MTTQIIINAPMGLDEAQARRVLVQALAEYTDRASWAGRTNEDTDLARILKIAVSEPAPEIDRPVMPLPDSMG